jgi:hypothetical protein
VPDAHLPPGAGQPTSVVPDSGLVVTAATGPVTDERALTATKT